MEKLNKRDEIELMERELNEKKDILNSTDYYHSQLLKDAKRGLNEREYTFCLKSLLKDSVTSQEKCLLRSVLNKGIKNAYNQSAYQVEYIDEYSLFQSTKVSSEHNHKAYIEKYLNQRRNVIKAKVFNVTQYEQ